MREVTVVSHQKSWTVLYQNEVSSLKKIFDNLIVSVYHIGSTAIPGIMAKPVIDILIVVTDIEEIDLLINQMKKLGYASWGENGILNRRFFSKGNHYRTHHVHVFKTGNPEINRHLLFRDYLLAHPDDAKQYSLLKQRLASKYKTNIEMYVQGKNQYIKEIDKKASAWSYKIKRLD